MANNKHFDIGINIEDSLKYPDKCPFHPQIIFPELQHLGLNVTDIDNNPYSNISQLFIEINLDSEMMKP